MLKILLRLNLKLRQRSSIKNWRMLLIQIQVQIPIQQNIFADTLTTNDEVKTVVLLPRMFGFCP
jgi:hypothetical protein